MCGIARVDWVMADQDANSPESQVSNGIGQLNERSLHAQIKDRLAQPGDAQEQVVDGYVIDLVRGNLLIEVQTRHLGAMKKKLAKLLQSHDVCLVYPLIMDKWIRTLDAERAETLRRRKSPRKGKLCDLFDELVYIPHLLDEPRLTLRVLCVQVEEVRSDDGKGSWRRKGISIVDQRLLDVVDEWTIHQSIDLLELLPPELPCPFTNRELAKATHLRMRQAQKMSYTLRAVGLIEQVGKRSRANLYDRAKCQ